jgi:hypothetical protein
MLMSFADPKAAILAEDDADADEALVLPGEDLDDEAASRSSSLRLKLSFTRSERLFAKMRDVICLKNV